MQQMRQNEKRKVDMRKKLIWLVLLSAAIVVTAIFYAGNVRATMGNGFVAETLAQGTLGEFQVFNQSILPNSTGDENIWLSMQETKGSSDLFVQRNTWAKGGSTGWHSHPGHSLIIVTEGEVTNYESDDPECTPHRYSKGMSFVDSGGSHVHIIRNESTTEEAETIAVQLIPAGAMRRIDVPVVPANCPNIQ